MVYEKCFKVCISTNSELASGRKSVCLASGRVARHTTGVSRPCKPCYRPISAGRYQWRSASAPSTRWTATAMAHGDDFFDPNIAPSVEDLSALLERKQTPRTASGPGDVYLVGTGPGDPSLLTMKALQLMQCAQVVLYDRLVSEEILELINVNAQKVYVGKRSGCHHKSQDEINELMHQYAQAGYTVLRLKGGDPNIFGRGGEEMDYVRDRGIDVRTVPGITAAAGITAELQIPLTCRTIANSTTFLTGHSRVGGENPLDEIAARADERTTLVIYMGLATLPDLAERLQSKGLPASLPAVAVMKGTTPNQVAVFAPLRDLPAAVVKEGLKSPTLVVIGHVVALSPQYPGHAKQAVYKGKSFAREDVLDSKPLLEVLAQAERQLSGQDRVV